MRSQLTICRRLPSLLLMMILLNHEVILIFFYLMETNFARTAKRGGEDEAIARNVLGLCHLSADQINFAVSNNILQPTTRNSFDCHGNRLFSRSSN